jgi:hypothetical protein
MISVSNTAALVKRIGVAEAHLVETLERFDSLVEP